VIQYYASLPRRAVATHPIKRKRLLKNVNRQDLLMCYILIAGGGPFKWAELDVPQYLPLHAWNK